MKNLARKLLENINNLKSKSIKEDYFDYVDNTKVRYCIKYIVTEGKNIIEKGYISNEEKVEDSSDNDNKYAEVAFYNRFKEILSDYNGIEKEFKNCRILNKHEALFSASEKINARWITYHIKVLDVFYKGNATNLKTFIENICQDMDIHIMRGYSI